MQDPTRDEIVTVLKAYHFYNETDYFDCEAAMYWFASDWHGGQWSNLYSILSTSHYHPGTLETGPKTGLEADLYLELVNAFGGD